MLFAASAQNFGETIGGMICIACIAVPALRFFELCFDLVGEIEPLNLDTLFNDIGGGFSAAANAISTGISSLASNETVQEIAGAVVEGLIDGATEARPGNDGKPS